MPREEFLLDGGDVVVQATKTERGTRRLMHECESRHAMRVYRSIDSNEV